MNATFTNALRYCVTATCVSPLRTGGDINAVLRTEDGAALLQGSSLAGALREFSLGQLGKGQTELFFGTQDREGSLIVSDGIFEDAKQKSRPRLRMDSKTGTGATGGKFDVAHLEVGSQFSFQLIWRGGADSGAAERQLLLLLSALHSGSIRLGAQCSNGFGQVSLTVKLQRYDMCTTRGRNAWQKNTDLGEDLVLTPNRQGRVRFTLKAEAESLLIKAATGSGVGAGSADAIQMTEGGLPVVPGSSVKGVLRGQAVKIAQALGLDATAVDRCFGCAGTRGNDGLPGQVWFGDARFDKTPQKRKITRIHVDRFTGGVIRQGLFTEEPVSGTLTITADAVESPEVCTLLLYALRDLGLGLVPLGSGGSVGRGYLKGQRLMVTAPDGTESTLVFSPEGGVIMEDTANLFARWRAALGGTQHEA